MTHTNIRAIIFDLDGVLIDSEPLHEKSMLTAFAAHGIAFPEALFADYRGKTDFAVVEHAAATYHDGPPLDLDAVIASKQEAYRALVPELELIAGARDFLNHAKAQSLRLGLTTSAERINQQLAFDRFDLSDFFEVVVTSEDVELPKPDPQPYRLTAERLGLPTSRCVVFEDSVNGVLSAVGAGCRVVGLSTSFPGHALATAGAHIVIDSYGTVERDGGIPVLLQALGPIG